MPLPNVNDPRYAEANTSRINQLLDSYNYVELPTRGTLYLDGPIVTPANVGCGRIFSRGSHGYSHDVSSDPIFQGQRLKIVQLGNCEAIRVRGTGFVCEGAFELYGNGIYPAIRVENRTFPATGVHTFRHILFRNWTYAFNTPGGYFDANSNLVANGDHGDNTLVSLCEIRDTTGWYHGQCQQSVNWYFDDCYTAYNSGGTVTLADLDNCGLVHFHRHRFLHNNIRLFDVENFSPNYNWLSCTQFEFDRNTSGTPLFEIIKLSGDQSISCFSDWYLDVDGFLPQALTPTYNIPGNMPRTHYSVNIRSLYM